jgi:hypothetical protein
MKPQKFFLPTRLLWSFLLLACFVAAAFAGDQRKKSNSLKKPTKSVDIAVGMLDAGKLQHAVFNDGRIGTWDYRTEVPAITYKGYSYLAELNMMIGVPEGPWTPKYFDPVKRDSVSMGPSVSATYEGNDWGPRAGSFGNLHSGDVVMNDVLSATDIGALPVIATSTIPNTWPKDASGNRFWPGPWARDPKTGVELPGTFTSDKDVFFSMTDFDLDDTNRKYAERDGHLDQGYALGLECQITGYSYGRSYAEDFIFFPMKIVNHSNNNYTGVYVGFYIDVDLPEYNSSRTINDRNDWMSFLKEEYDAEFDTTYAYNLAYFYDYRWGTGNFSGVENVDAWKAHVAVKLLETPFGRDGKQLGLTDWHWFRWEDRPGVVNSTRAELMQYKILSGDSTGLMTNESDAYFWPNPATNIVDPHFDSPEGIRTLYPEGTDCVFIMSSGPFDLPAGGSTTFSFCLLMGDDLEDLKQNARTSQLMYDKYYQGANPPKPPAVTAAPGDHNVTLYWNDVAEKSTDILTNYRDFEGYKIYRTTSHPSRNEWGDKIYDGKGNHVGFVPMAQFDLANGVKDLDPEYPHLNRGSDNGLVHSFVDETVQNGVTYWYSVTAYDRGLQPHSVLNPDKWANLNYLENAQGNNVGSVPNLVEVIPGPVAAGYQAPKVLAVKPDPDSLGKGTVDFTVFEPFALKDQNTYQIVFSRNQNKDSLFYSVKEASTAKTLVAQSPYTNGEDSGPVFDGMRLRVDEYASKITPRDVKWTKVTGAKASTYTFSLLSEFGAGTGRPQDYELRWTGGAGDTILVGGTKTVPFQIWNLTEKPPKQVNLLATNPTRLFASGDQITLLEYTVRDRTWRFTVSWDSTNIAPSPGDVLLFRTYKPFLEGEALTFTTTGVQFASSLAEGKKVVEEVRVVPNPYIVSAAWELDANAKKLQFNNLPPVCEIYIYTLTGDLVQKLSHNSRTQSWEFWDLLSYNRQAVAYGLYLFAVETPDGQKKIGKFSIIR